MDDQTGRPRRLSEIPVLADLEPAAPKPAAKKPAWKPAKVVPDAVAVPGGRLHTVKAG